MRKRSLPSPSSHTFAEVPRADIPRSVFIRSSGVKTAFNSGYLVPIFSDEVLPGDTFRLESQLFGRLSTLLHPYMDNVFIDTHYFFVPFRILWDNWEKFCGAQDNPGDSIDFSIPQVAPADSSGGFGEMSLFDFFGIPPNVEDISISAMYSRAYNLIWNEYFRDQNLQDSAVVDKGNGPDDPADYIVRRRGKRHDYFTSCLPSPQKGPAVGLPLTGNAAITGTGSLDANGEFRLQNAAGTRVDGFQLASSSVDAPWEADNVSGSGNITIQARYNSGLTFDPAGGTPLEADLSGVSAVTINAFRQAYSLQRFLEKDARGGTRYFEMLQSHFRVSFPDSRLQRPEYLGGGSARIDVHTVAQTSETTTESPLGELAGYAIMAPSRHGFIKSFVEHGVVIGLASVRSDMTYQQGIERRFSRQTRYDFYWPAFAQLGEQAVLNKEIFASGTALDDDPFGYQERHGEYRYKPSIVTSVMRSDAASSLDTWHLAFDFSATPELGDEFIQDDPPLDRVLAVQSSVQPQIILDCYHKLKCARPMPLYGVPGLGDRF